MAWFEAYWSSLSHIVFCDFQFGTESSPCHYMKIIILHDLLWRSTRDIFQGYRASVMTCKMSYLKPCISWQINLLQCKMPNSIFCSTQHIVCKFSRQKRIFIQKALTIFVDYICCSKKLWEVHFLEYHVTSWSNSSRQLLAIIFCTLPFWILLWAADWFFVCGHFVSFERDWSTYLMWIDRNST